MKSNFFFLLLILFNIISLNFIFLKKIDSIANNQYRSNSFIFEVENFNYIAKKTSLYEMSNFIAIEDYYQNPKKDKNLFLNSLNYVYSARKTQTDFIDFKDKSNLKKYLIYNFFFKTFFYTYCKKISYGICYLKIEDKNIKNKLFQNGYLNFKADKNLKFIYVETANYLENYTKDIQLSYFEKKSNKLYSLKLDSINSYQANFASKNYIVINLKKNSHNEKKSIEDIILKIKPNKIKNIFFNDINNPIDIFTINTSDKYHQQVLGIDKNKNSLFADQYCRNAYNKCSYYSILPQLINQDVLIENLKKNFFTNQLEVDIRTFDISHTQFNLILNFKKDVKSEFLEQIFTENKLIKSQYNLSLAKTLNYYNKLFYTNLFLSISFLLWYIYLKEKKNNLYKTLIGIFFFIIFLYYNINLNFSSIREWIYHASSINFILFFALFKVFFKNIFISKFKYQIVIILLTLDFLIFYWSLSIYFFTFYIMVDLILFLFKYSKFYDKKKYL